MSAALTGRYAIERELGHGGTAVVYLAQDLRHSRPVAIKVLRPELSAVVGAERFLREIEIVARLQHPHILPLYDSGEADGLLYFVMPFVPGESLRTRLDREKQLPLAEVVALTRDVAEALAFAHGQGVVHRDVKPENILLFGGSAVVADFGIARALRVAGSGRMTEVGVALGTPLYMSPEQAAGASDVDGRSDTYSLGCVVYEMLAGEAPFGGVNPLDVMTHHIRDTPRPLQQLRASLPHPVSVAISRALAKHPADRFAHVGEFSSALALGAGLAAPGETASLRLDRRPIAAVATVVLILVAGAFLARRALSDTRLDQSRYAVVPFTELGATPPSGMRGDQLAMLLRSSLTRWRDLVVVGDALVDVPGDDRVTLERALAMARKVGAGSLVWGEQVVAGDSIQLNVALYDANGDGQRLRQARVRVAADGSDMAARVGALADSLVADRVTSRFGAAAIGTTLREAWSAYASGHSALADWELDTAEREFQRAVSSDPEFALAELWLAQTRAWAGQPVSRWQGDARAAAANRARLSSARDSAYAAALLAMAEERFPEACAEYEGLLARDSTDVVALLGLGDCHHRDRVVVRDAASPSGWAFRSSMHRAVWAYGRAMQLAPAFSFTLGPEPYARMARLFVVEDNWLRSGRASAPDTGMFGAFPSLVADTIAFVPGPWRAVLRGERPSTHREALAKNLRALSLVADRWVSEYPRHAEAHALRSLLHELEGNLIGGNSASASIGEALRLAPGREAALRFGVQQVRIELKSGAIDTARARAESLLARWPEPTSDEARWLAGVAALVGRVGLAAELDARAVAADTSLTGWLPSRQTAMVGPVLAAARRFAAYAGVGAPADSLLRLAQTARAMIDRYIEPSERTAAWDALITPYLELAWFDAPALRPRQWAGNYLKDAQAALARGDRVSARRLILDRHTRARSRPGEEALAPTLAEVRVLLAAGDTAGAIRLLDPPLDDLAVAPTLLIDEPAMAAAVGRSYILSAELARLRADTTLARRRAAAAIALWSGADALLQPQLESVRALAR